MFIVLGLGNPGKEYAKTRHNMGFMALDLLAKKWDIPISKSAFHATVGEGFVDGKKVVLAKPDTFMNNSGLSAMALMNYYKCAHHELLVIYDDADLPVGVIRIRESGSAGTHNGMRSIVSQLGYCDFPRIRVGIGSAAYDIVKHVLSKPSDEEMALIEAALLKAADAAELIVKGELKLAQERFNIKPSTAKKRMLQAEQGEETREGSGERLSDNNSRENEEGIRQGEASFEQTIN